MDNVDKDKHGMTTRDWKWLVSILIGIIVFILSYKFWGKSGELTDIISIGSGLVSIALAIVAIIITVAESIKTNNKEEKVQVGLDEIIKNTNTMSALIHKLEMDIFKTRNQITSLERRFTERYTKDLQTFRPSEKKTYDNNNTIDKNPTKQTPTAVKHKGHEKENPNGSDNIESQFRIVKRGDVYFCDLSPVLGSEQGGVRPVLVITNDIANRFSPTINIAAITAQIQKAKLPTHVEIDAERYGFEKDSVIMLEQTRTIDKQRLTEKITHLDDDIMEKVDEALLIQLGLVEF